MFPLHVSNEIYPCLRYVGDDTTQLYRDYTKPLMKDPKKNTHFPLQFFFSVAYVDTKSHRTEPPIRLTPQGVDGRVGKFVWHSGCRGRRPRDDDISWRWKKWVIWPEEFGDSTVSCSGKHVFSVWFLNVVGLNKITAMIKTWTLFFLPLLAGCLSLNESTAGSLEVLPTFLSL